ncbi:hypothetical protein [Bacillus wiedmannii]|uniref:hypothetical protein n=1 Tax=Bacillus wiedmannii TaxID=1890302 RepID=UPI001C3DE5F1
MEKQKDLLPVLLKGNVFLEDVIKSIATAEVLQDEQEVLYLEKAYKSDAKKKE